MRRIVWIALPLVAGVGATGPVSGQGPAAAPAPAAGAPAPAAARQKMDQLLGLWAQRSAQISTLDASFDRVDESKLWDDVTHYKGRALLKGPNLACLNLEAVDKSGQTSFYNRVICTGKEVWEYDGASKQITVHPLPQDQQQRALQQGPLPFLFDMRIDDVKARYDMVLTAENDKVYRIQIWPKKPIDRDAFSVAVVDLNKQKFLPDALHLLSSNGKDMQRYYFTTGKVAVGEIAITASGKILPNEPINDVNFQGKPWANWKVVVNPPEDASAAAAPPGAGPRVPQPAMRPAAPAGRR